MSYQIILHNKENTTARFLHLLQQGIINMNRNAKAAIFFSYVCNDKKIQELFASNLNGIPASVRCVSSMIVILNAKFARILAPHADKKSTDV